MMKNFTMIFLLLPMLTFAQHVEESGIKIEAKPLDSKKGYIFEIYKAPTEVKVVYRKVDSIGKISYSEKDLLLINKLKDKPEEFFDSLGKDSLLHFQQRLDSIKNANTFYSSDSTTIYKTTHSTYWKLLETIFKAPNEVLENKIGNKEEVNVTFYFFTLLQGPNKEIRNLSTDSDDPKMYPLLGRLIGDTAAIIYAHQQVMKRKNQ
jgi:hypothetical protein